MSQTAQFLNRSVHAFTNCGAGAMHLAARAGSTTVGKNWPFHALAQQNMQLFSVPGEPPSFIPLQGRHAELVAQ